MAGEALDCEACGVAVVAPDPLRDQPAILFAELLGKMGITQSDEAPAPQRQIAKFKLQPNTDDALSWLDAEPEVAGNREPMWSRSPAVPVTEPSTAEIAAAIADTPQRSKVRRDPRSTPLRIAPPKLREGGVPKKSFSRFEITAATAAVLAVGAVSYTLFLAPGDEQTEGDGPANSKSTTAVLSQPSPETPTAQPAAPIATRPSDPILQAIESLPAADGPLPADQQASQDSLPKKGRNGKILNFEKSRDALRAFCDATTADERLQFVLDPDEHEEDVRRYHKEHGAACFQLRELIHGQTAQSAKDGRYWSSFLVQTNKNPRGFTVRMQETDSGPRLSWPAFVQHHDGTFETFLEQQPGEPHVFCATLSRGYSIDPNAPDPANFHCFRVQGSETPRGKAKAYVDRRSLLGEQLERNLDWDSEMPVTAELRWIRDENEPDAPPVLEISEVLEYHW